jgi:hypothetical protein
MRHVRNALVGSDTFGHVFMGCQPPAGGRRLVPNFDQPTITGLYQ